MGGVGPYVVNRKHDPADATSGRGLRTIHSPIGPQAFITRWVLFRVFPLPQPLPTSPTLRLDPSSSYTPPSHVCVSGNALVR